MQGCLIGPKHTPMAQNTIFGWILSGPVGDGPQEASSTLQVSHLVSLNDFSDLHADMKRFWEVENGCLEEETSKTSEEDFCEKHFLENFSRDSDGKYCVKIPLKEDPSCLGNSKEIAVKKLNSMWNRLSKDPHYLSLYKEFLSEYEQLGHMTEVKDSGEINGQYYIPHLGVYRPDRETTKLRVVFNASSPTSNGNSLNSLQYNGGVIQDDLFSIILRFRKHLFAFTSDVRMMYRMIWVHPDQRCLQRILWKNDKDQPIKTFELATITYGLVSASYLATRVLKQLANDERADFPQAANVVENEFYMDDVLSGSSSLEKAVHLKQELVELMKRGGMELHKWSANHPELISQQPKSPTGYDFSKETKVLGLLWQPDRDFFSYKVAVESPQIWTKRSVLSAIAKTFDPLGLIGPVITKAKIFMQRMWSLSLDWSDPLPEKEAQEWNQFVSSIACIQVLQISRCVLSETMTNFELHGFSDASEKAYGAAIYIKCMSSNDNVKVSLLCSKSRVSPLKKISIPRLELSGALLLAQLFDKVSKSLKLVPSKCYLWCDSTIVLAWLKNDPSKLKTFVANRAAEIKKLTNIEEWHHVVSQQNPADLLSRGLDPAKLVNNHLWFTGPQFLNQSSLPESDEHSLAPEFYNEFKKSKQTKQECVSLSTAMQPNFDLSERFSSLTKLQRVTAFVLRFIKNCKSSKSERISGPLASSEINEALFILIKIHQSIEFPKEISALRKDTPLSSKSKLLSLAPFLDKDGILRLGGRLQNSNLKFSEKHPIILASSPLSKLIIKKTHLEALHGGTQLVINMIRRKYWILSCRNAIRKIIHECIKCWRYKATSAEQQMGILPLPRVNMSRPFSHTGVDYFGPIELKANKTRKAPIYKGYVSVFVCLATKAVHLEVVTDLTTDAFLAAFRRFTSRRGLCSDIYSDQGSNFKGASRILKDDFQECIKQIEEEISVVLANDLVTWHFNPPFAPHQGGLWEAAVKSTKFHLKRILGSTRLTFEEMSTLLSQIEAVLNSRPLCPLTSDPDDMTPLTPSHFLVGDILKLPPQPSLLDVAENRLDRWQKLQQMTQHFWSRWKKEYLNRLQTRPKWMTPQSNIEKGELVVVKDLSLPPAKWLLARVIDTHPGNDGLVRVVTIRTKDSCFKRPIAKVCRLPFK